LDGSAFGLLDGEAAGRRRLVLREQVQAGLTHRLDAVVERHDVPAVAAEPRRGGRPRLDRAWAVALDAAHLHAPARGIAGHPQMVLEGGPGGVLDRGVGAARPGAEPRRRR
jgi:hypothetical protein